MWVGEAGGPRVSWGEADCYAKLAGLGWSTRKIADECGTNRETVRVMVNVVTRYPVSLDRPTFWHAYAEVTGERTQAGKDRA